MLLLNRILIMTALISTLAACGGGSGSDSGSVEFSDTSSFDDNDNSSSPIPNPPINSDNSDPVNPTAPSTPEGVSVNATFSWSRPLQRENGDTLAEEEIVHYEIIYTDPEGQIHVEQISATETSWSTVLNEGNYEFAIAAADIYGLSSNLSEAIVCGISPEGSTCN
jgi:hypothetical protein